MKKLLGFTFVLGIGCVLGALSLAVSLPARAGSGAPTATKNGDTNGDGTIDISDGVYLLNFLFTGGADLAEIQCPVSPPGSRLVATGVKQCYGVAGPPIECSAAKARGQDGFYQLGCPPEGRFADNGDGTISDNCTGLMWTKNFVDVDNDGEILPADAKTWIEACQFAEDMTYLGHDDWRVPNIQELLSIVDFGKASGSNAPLFPGFGFQIIDGHGTWSSTVSYNSGGRALALGLNPDTNNCECCVIRNLNTGPIQTYTFVAVRGGS